MLSIQALDRTPPLSGAAAGLVTGSDNALDAARRQLLCLHVTREDRQPVAGWASALEVENTLDFEVFNHYIATTPNPRS
jgi:hypothetical protein